MPSLGPLVPWANRSRTTALLREEFQLDYGASVSKFKFNIYGKRYPSSEKEPKDLHSTAMKSTPNDVERAVADLKDAIKDIIHEECIYADEFYLLRWLKAGSMDVQRAEKDIRNVAKWRREFGMVALVEEGYPKGWLQTIPIFIDTVTPEGVLVACIQAGCIDFRGILNEIGKKTMVRVFMQAFAQVERVLVDLNRIKFGSQALTENCVQGAIMLIDMDQFQSRQLRTFEGLQAVIEICKNMVKYFPYVSSMFMFINCNTVTSALFRVMRPIVEGPSLKFEVYGQDRAAWQQKVLSFVPANLIREPFGGTIPTDEVIKRDHMVDRSLLLSCARNME